jgi:RHS repeat-associated protein
MRTAAKQETFSAPMVWTDECVVPLAASGVYPKTRVWGSKPENVHCSSATAPLKIELRRGCEKSSEKSAVGSGDTFKYDPFGMRIYKSSSGGTSVFAYDGDKLIEETNASGVVVSRYAQARNIDEPLAMLRSSATSYYSADGLGSVTSLTNSSGAAAETYTYDSFGKVTASSGSVTNPFQYTGREMDAETGLYYYRARYYDPASGRFLSEDPVRFSAGVNFYDYVYNNPVRYADPMGLSPQDAQRIQLACKKCTQQLTDAGLRGPGSGRWNGWWNDFTYWFTKRLSCYGQAQATQPCLSNPAVPYDDNWTFTVVPLELGTHRVVMGWDLNPNDPVVYCDPWRDTFWTAPKPPTGPTSGGGGF